LKSVHFSQQCRHSSLHATEHDEDGRSEQEESRSHEDEGCSFKYARDRHGRPAKSPLKTELIRGQKWVPSSNSRWNFVGVAGGDVVLHLRCMREEAGGNEADADMKNVQESSNCMEGTD
jgi:hypothetical protein